MIDFYVTHFTNDLRLIDVQGKIMVEYHKGNFKFNINVEEPDSYASMMYQGINMSAIFYYSCLDIGLFR